MDFTYDYYQKSAEYLKTRIREIPDVAIVLGSCLGEFGETLEDAIEVPYGDIPNFLISTAPHHAGKLIFGRVGEKKVVCMSGRFHSYEGYDFEQLTIPIRVLHLLGVKITILTNAAGAVNLDYRPGDIMVISDHIKLTGPSPLRGPNIPEFGDRFFDTTAMYPKYLRDIALSIDTPLNLHEGVYMFFTGPQFETPAEIRAARILGADAVGMSTVTEALTAAHCKMPILALSVMTNMAAGVLDQPLTAAEVNETGAAISNHFGNYVRQILQKI